MKGNIMAIPKIDLPIYELKLPSNGKEVRVRPFVVREEKLLLMAAASDDTDEIIKTTKQIINNCLIDNDVKIDTLPFFDVDYLFIALRAKSIGEKIDMSFTCNNALNDNTVCKSVFDVPIDIANAHVVKPEGISNKIDLGGNLSVKLKYPNYTITKLINDDDSIIDKKIKVIANCIETIVQGDKVMTTKDFTKKEAEEFVEDLTKSQFEKLEEFVDNFPYFVVDLDHKCQKCGFEHHIEYRDFASFFQ
jgi:hypothetical protein